jgi:hypothetical protein
MESLDVSAIIDSTFPESDSEVKEKNMEIRN